MGTTWAWSPSALSQGSSPAQIAPESGSPQVDADVKARFGEALKLYQQGDLDRALPLFRQVAKATGSPNARLYVGYCLLQSGKRVLAYQAFSQTLRDIADHPDEKYAETHEAAQAQLAILNVHLAKLVILVADAPPDLKVTLDGAELMALELGSSRVIEPGNHRIQATAPAFTPLVREFSVQGGEVKAIGLSLRRLEPAAPSGSSTERGGEATADSRTLGRTRTAGLVAAGAGLAGLAVFAVTGWMAKSTFDRLSRECSAGCSDSAHLDDVHRGQSLQTAANVSLVLGLAGVGLGGTLFFLGSGKDRDTRASAGTWSTGGALVSYGSKF
jgi:hypothetical protein